MRGEEGEVRSARNVQLHLLLVAHFFCCSSVCRFHENFVVREWVDIDQDMEFRGFCHNGQLTALSQYHHLVYFPRLQTMKEHIERTIRHFFDTQVAPLITQQKLPNCIVDFALSGPEYSRVWVIELNPFLETTDGCLFSWNKERHVLENGPWEFRMRTHKVRGSKSMISDFWRQIMDDCSDSDNSSNSNNNNSNNNKNSSNDA